MNFELLRSLVAESVTDFEVALVNAHSDGSVRDACRRVHRLVIGTRILLGACEASVVATRRDLDDALQRAETHLNFISSGAAPVGDRAYHARCALRNLMTARNAADHCAAGSQRRFAC